MQFYRLSAEQGYAEAQYSLALCLLERAKKQTAAGVGVGMGDRNGDHRAIDGGSGDRDHDHDHDHDRNGGDNSDNSSSSSGGVRNKDAEEAVQYFALAAAQDHAAAQYQLALCHLTGATSTGARGVRGLEASAAQGVKLLLGAADLGDVNAQFKLGYLYDPGTPLFVPQVAHTQGYSITISTTTVTAAAAATATSTATATALVAKIGEGEGESKSEVDSQEDTRNASAMLIAPSPPHPALMLPPHPPADAAPAIAVLPPHGRANSIFLRDTSCTKNAETAVKYYRLAAEQGHATAQLNLGICYYNGTGVARNRIAAMLYYRLAADQGDPHAQFNFAVCCARGEAPGHPVEEAARYYERAAAAGQRDAQFNLGVCYAKGRCGVSKDMDAAVKYYRLAAAQGQLSAQFNLAGCYAKGYGVRRTGAAAEEAEAEAEWSPKMEREILSAPMEAGDTDRGGGGREFQQLQGWRQAVQLYRSAAEKGHVGAQLKLGMLYASGVPAAGVPAAGVPPPSADGASGGAGAGGSSINATGERGCGMSSTSSPRIVLPKDEKLAVSYFLAAAEGGSAVAQYRLGACYAAGVGVSGGADPQRALEWLQEAAAQGQVNALFSLGWSYEHGPRASASASASASVSVSVSAEDQNEDIEDNEDNEDKERKEESGTSEGACACACAPACVVLVEQRDLVRAAWYYEQAAALGHLPAQRRLQQQHFSSSTSSSFLPHSTTVPHDEKDASTVGSTVAITAATTTIATTIATAVANGASDVPDIMQRGRTAPLPLEEMSTMKPFS
jgi:TPR repeat protein